MTSMMISSFMWILPLLLLGKNKIIEEVSEPEIVETENHYYIQEYLNHVDYIMGLKEQPLISYDIDDAMISVAITNKIAARKVSEDFAFSIN